MNIAVVGAGGGIGHALTLEFMRFPQMQAMFTTYHQREVIFDDPRVTCMKMDVSEDRSVEAWGQTLPGLDILVNAVGQLHTTQHLPEKSIRQLNSDFFMENMRINVLPTLLLARCLQGRFAQGRPGVFATISARIGSISDNRLGGWYSYRASKAALNMSIKTLSLEWMRTFPQVAVVALHPGTTDTALSKPFQRNVPSDKLFDPSLTARHLVNVIQRLGPQDTGSFLDYNGDTIPW